MTATLRVAGGPDAVLETCTIQTPVGILGLVAGAGALRAAGFAPVADLLVRLDPTGRLPVRDRRELGDVTRALARYFAGQVDALDHIPVDQPGTPHQQEVWAALRTVPAGQTRTYTELAGVTGRPAAVRAAGAACARNLVAPVVPCHRAVRRDGSLAGYYYGLDVKRWLQAHESRAS